MRQPSLIAGRSRAAARLQVAALAATATILGVLTPLSAAQAVDTGSITGSVTADGAPVAGASVNVYQAESGPEWVEQASTLTDASGDYAVALPAGEFVVCFVQETHPDLVPECHDNAPYEDTATTVSVAAGAITDVDADLATYGHVTGQVTGDDAPGGLAGVFVAAWGLDEEDFYGWSLTQPDGSYDLEVPPGTYKLGFHSADYVLEYWDDADFAAATEITVESGQSITGKNAELALAAVLTMTAPPAITGDPLVGATLTATPGTYSPAAEDVSYQWYSDDTPVGTDSNTYVVAAADLGSSISVEVMATKSGYAPFFAGSDPTSPVTQPAIANASAPVISDTTPEVGQTLTTNNGTWNPATGLGYAYQWFAAGGPVGTNSASYTVDAADLGKAITVEVTATKAGFTPGEATSSATAAVVEASAFTNTTAPAISDSTPMEGQTLSSTTGVWSQSPDSFSYQWKAAGSPVGTNSSNYTVGAGDVGKAITVSVTATKAGAPVVANSAATAAVANAPVVNYAGVYVSTTQPKVGHSIFASIGTVAPDVSVAWQWYAGGQPVPGATQANFAPTAAQVGMSLRVRAVASKPGSDSVAAMSAPTAGVLAGTFAFGSRPTIVGKLRVGRTLTAVPGFASPSADVVQYRWLRNGRPIRGATAATYRLRRIDRGDRISVRVTYLKGGYTPAKQVSPRTRRIR